MHRYNRIPGSATLFSADAGPVSYRRTWEMKACACPGSSYPGALLLRTFKISVAVGDRHPGLLSGPQVGVRLCPDLTLTLTPWVS